MYTPTLHGHNRQLVARFEVIVGGVRMKNCALLHSAQGWQIWGPSRYVSFSADLKYRIKEAVKDGYAALGGRVNGMYQRPNHAHNL